jgi:hypothetical protein
VRIVQRAALFRWAHATRTAAEGLAGAHDRLDAWEETGVAPDGGLLGGLGGAASAEAKAVPASSRSDAPGARQVASAVPFATRLLHAAGGRLDVALQALVVADRCRNEAVAGDATATE